MRIKAAGGAEKGASVSAYRDHVHFIGGRSSWEKEECLLLFLLLLCTQAEEMYFHIQHSLTPTFTLRCTLYEKYTTNKNRYVHEHSLTHTNEMWAIE